MAHARAPRRGEQLRRQLADRRLWRLALPGYTAQKAWPQGRVVPDCELLSHAAHPRNVAAAEQLAADGSLGRIGSVTVSDDLRVRTRPTTYREHRGGERTGPPVVYSLFPLRGGEEADGVVVAGAAVCELADGDEACVSRGEVTLRHAAGDTGGFYVETWGSTTIPYDVSVELEPGLVPLLVTCTGKAGDDPRTPVTFDRWGCRVELDGTGGRPWLGELSMFVGRAPELYERTFLALPYTTGLDFARYNRMTAPFPY